MMRMMSVVVEFGLSFYQRYMSPHKGFCCAYRVHTGRWSCSGYARMVNRRHSVWVLWAGMRRQFARCHAAHLALQAARQEENDKKSSGGDCGASDCCCDAGCDVISCGRRALLSGDGDCIPCDCSP